MIRLNVNGAERELEIDPMERLLDVLRDRLRLTGTKEGCGEGECGACSVWLDGQVVNSCLIPVAQAAGHAITTIEGIQHPLQERMVRAGGVQCGICTPGIVMSAAALLRDCPRPSALEAREALAGNLCRCTGYQLIIDAVCA
jgi:carbon-monoxide dehydrogenase small subunit